MKKKLKKLLKIEGVAIDTKNKELTLREEALQEVSGLLDEDFEGWTVNIIPHYVTLLRELKNFKDWFVS